MDAAAYAYGVPLHDKSVDAALDYEVCQWAFMHPKDEMFVKNQDDKGEGKGVDNTLFTDIVVNDQNQNVTFSVLLQRVDVDAMRASSEEPFAVYSANRYSVNWAVRSIADAAATLHVSRMLSKYNQRARKLFEKSIESYNQKSVEQFKGLFDQMDPSDGVGGYVLLKAKQAKEYGGLIESCSVAVPSENSAKRVRLFSESDNSHFSTPLVPSLSTSTRRQHGIFSDDVPALGCLPDIDYEIVAGSVSRIFSHSSSTVSEFMAHVMNSKLNMPEIKNHDNPVSKILSPRILRREEMIELRTKCYNDAKYAVLNVTVVLEHVIKCCKLRRERFVMELRNARDDISVLNRATVADQYEYDFIRWCSRSPLNAPLFFTTEATTISEMIRNRIRHGLDGGDGDDPYHGRENDNDASRTIFMSTQNLGDESAGGLGNPGVSGIAVGLEDENEGDDDTVNTTENDDDDDDDNDDDDNKITVEDVLGWYSSRDTNNFVDFVSVGDLLKVTQQEDFSTAMPRHGDRLAGVAAHPTALTDAYSSLVMQPESQLRFKLSLTKYQGFNPAFFQGERSENPLGVDNDENHVDFDDDIKRFEFDLHARDCRGYQEEYVATMRMLFQVIFSTSRKPDVTNMAKFGELDMLNEYGVDFGMGQGFVFVPRCFPRLLMGETEFLKLFKVPLVDSEQYQKVVNFPSWASTGYDDGPCVSSASLYFWNNAISTVCHPFSVSPDNVKINDVAAVLAMSEPFCAMEGIERDIVTTLLKKIQTRALFNDDECLHLIQLTSASVAPGLCDYVQSFPPMTVHFKGAAIEKVDVDKDDNPKFKITYSLGTESTILIEAMMIATALIKVLVLNRGSIKKDEATDTDFNRPKTYTKITRFPMDRYDYEVKDDYNTKRFTGYDSLHGYSTMFSSSGSHDRCYAFEKYDEFIGYSGSNVAGNISWGNPSGDMSRHKICSGYYNILMSTEFTIDFSEFSVPPVSDIKRNTYDDFLAWALFGGIRAYNEYEQDNVRFHTLDFTEGEYICFPMYVETDIKEVVAYATVEILNKENEGLAGGAETLSSGAGVFGGGVDIQPSAAAAYSDDDDWLTVTRTKSNTRIISRGRIRCKFKSIFITTPVAWDYALDVNSLCVGDNPGISIGINLSEECATRSGYGDGFIRLHQFEQGAVIAQLEGERVRDNLLSCTKFKPSKSPIDYQKVSTGPVDLDNISKLVQEGCQGYHFSRRDALSRTVFAVAINDTKNTIQNWYEKRDDIGPSSLQEHRGIHLIAPHRHHVNCAKLMNIILRHEMRGSVTLGKMATTGSSLITPVVVNVLGPMESNLLTPCYIDNVFSKTARFRSVESQIIGMIESHLDMVRRIDAVKNRVRGCLAERIMAHRPRSIPSCKWMIDQRVQTVPVMATLLMRVNTYNEISSKTTLGRATTSVAIAYKEIEATLHNLLFKF